jgi:putative membrane protein
MSDEPRRSGRVVEKATAIDGPSFPAQQEGAEGTNGYESGDTSRPQAQQEARRVHVEATAIEDEQLSETDTQATSFAEQSDRRSTVWTSVFWLLIASTAFWGIGTATLTLVELWHQQILLAAPLALAGLILLVLLAHALYVEWQAVRMVDSLDLRREMVESAIRSGDLKSLRATLEPTLANLQSRYPNLIAEFSATACSRTQCPDYLELFENLVLSRLDKEAQALINRSSVTIGVAVAVSPHPALDALVVMWRAMAMTRKLAAIYGLSPTGYSSWRLMRHTLGSAMLAAGMETLTTLAIDQTERGIAERIGKYLSEGAVIIVRIRRLGRLTQKICRPLEGQKTI